MIIKKSCLLLLSGLVIASLLQSAVYAAPASYPNGPVNFIVCYPPGGGSDTGARILASYAEPYLGKIIVRNKPGAGGAVGWTSFANAKPDGQTIALINIPTLIFLPLQGFANYKLEQITPVIQLVNDPALLVAQKGSGFQNYAEFIAYAKQHPGKVFMATCGVGSDIHIISEMLSDRAGVELVHIPFAGTAEAVTSVAGGHSHLSIPKVSEVLGALEAGQIIVLASFTESRLPAFPDVPTMKELGIDLVHSSARGVAVPAGTPQHIITFLHDSLKKATENPQYRSKMEKAGLTVQYRNGKDFERFYMEQRATFMPVFEHLGLTRK